MKELENDQNVRIILKTGQSRKRLQTIEQSKNPTSSRSLLKEQSKIIYELEQIQDKFLIHQLKESSRHELLTAKSRDSH